MAEPIGDLYTDWGKPWRQATAHLPQPNGSCAVCHGEVGHRINCPEDIAFSRADGAELQASLEEAVRQETARVDALGETDE